MSSTYKEDSFAREYLGLWTGGSENSWFDYDKLSKYRGLVNPEKSEKIEETPAAEIKTEETEKTEENPPQDQDAENDGTKK